MSETEFTYATVLYYWEKNENIKCLYTFLAFCHPIFLCMFQLRGSAALIPTHLLFFSISKKTFDSKPVKVIYQLHVPSILIHSRL